MKKILNPHGLLIGDIKRLPHGSHTILSLLRDKALAENDWGLRIKYGGRCTFLEGEHYTFNEPEPNACNALNALHIRIQNPLSCATNCIRSADSS